jgi:ketosteroid isomerase-like protein
MAKRVWLSFMALLLTLIASPKFWSQQQSAVARQIGQVEEQYSQSFVTGDITIAQRLLAEDFVGFDADTKRTDKARILEEVKNIPHLEALKITSLTVRQHGDTAIAFGEEEDTLPANAGKSYRRWIDTWQKTPQGWRLLSSAENEPKP